MKEGSVYINVTGKFFQEESIKFKEAGKNRKIEGPTNEVNR